MKETLEDKEHSTSREMVRFKIVFPIIVVAFVIMAILGLQTDFSVWVRLALVAGCIASVGIGVWISRPLMQDAGSKKP